MRQRTRGFTLIEILIVLAIIAILAALLFPAFKRAQESGYQASCATNLHQIYVALQLYRNDERRYPATLGALLPNDFSLNNVVVNTVGTPIPPPTPITNSGGTGYLKSANQYLLCPDDDTQATYPRTSYGDVSNGLAYVTPAYSATTLPPVNDMSQYVWNWYGYQNYGGTVGADGTAYINPPNTPSPCALCVNTAAQWDFRINPINYSLSNRFAPSGTIITHCIYHRLPTSNLSDSRELYTDTTTGDSTGAKDIILRLDGTAKTYDVNSFNQAPSGGYAPWQQQNF